MKGSKTQTIVRLIILSALLGVFSLTTAAAESITFFGPQSFTKAKGKPVTLSKSFNVPARAKNFQLWVKTGENGRTMGKNVEISVNDTVAVTSADLRKSNPLLIPVSLAAGGNTIDVSLSGNEGNYIMLYVTGEIVRDTPPVPVPPHQLPPHQVEGAGPEAFLHIVPGE